MDTPNAVGIEYTDQHRTCLLGRIHKTLDQSVLPHVDLDLHHNVTYEQPALLDLLTYIAMEGEFATNGARTRRVDAGDCTGIRRDDRSPLAKVLGYHLRQLDRSTVTTQFETIVAAIRRLATRARLLTTPVDLAIDVHDWLFYGDEDTPMVANTNPDSGTDLAFTFVTACIVTPGTRLTVAVVPLATKAALPAAVDEALRAAREWATIRRVVLDRGFYRVRVLDVLEEHDVDYVIRAPRFRRLDQGEPSVQVEQDYKVEQSNPSDRRGLGRGTGRGLPTAVRCRDELPRHRRFPPNITIDGLLRPAVLRSVCRNTAQSLGSREPVVDGRVRALRDDRGTLGRSHWPDHTAPVVAHAARNRLTGPAAPGPADLVVSDDCPEQLV